MDRVLSDLFNHLNTPFEIRNRVLRVYQNLNVYTRSLFSGTLLPQYFRTNQDLINYLDNLEESFQRSSPSSYDSIINSYGAIHSERLRLERFRERIAQSERLAEMERIRLERLAQLARINKKEIKVLGVEDYTEPDNLPECAICLEPISKRKGGRLHSYKDNLNQCGHIFHRRCLRTMIENNPGPSNPRCPICRAEIDAGSTFFGKTISDLEYLEKLNNN
jgi:hypothetical protein